MQTASLRYDRRPQGARLPFRISAKPIFNSCTLERLHPCTPALLHEINAQRSTQNAQRYKTVNCPKGPKKNWSFWTIAFSLSCDRKFCRLSSSKVQFVVRHEAIAKCRKIVTNLGGQKMVERREEGKKVRFWAEPEKRLRFLIGLLFTLTVLFFLHSLQLIHLRKCGTFTGRRLSKERR